MVTKRKQDTILIKVDFKLKNGQKRQIKSLLTSRSIHQEDVTIVNNYITNIPKYIKQICTELKYVNNNTV